MTTTRTGVLTRWALVPVVLWVAQIFAGLIVGSELCAHPTTMHGVAAALVAVSGFAVHRAWSQTRDVSLTDSESSPGLVGRVGFKVGLLFTAGIVLSWVMASVGCL